MRNDQAGTGNHNQVVPQKCSYGTKDRYLILIMLLIEEENLPLPIQKITVAQTQIGKVIEIQGGNIFNLTYNLLMDPSRYSSTRPTQETSII